MPRRRLVTVTAVTLLGLMALLCATLVAVAAVSSSSSTGSPATRLVGNVRQAPPPSSTTIAPAPAPAASSSSSTTQAPPASSTTSTSIYRGATCETSDEALAGDCGSTAGDARGWRTADGSACIVTDERTGRAWELEPDPACTP